MTTIQKTILSTLIPLIIGLAGNFIKNKFDAFSDDLKSQKSQTEHIMQLTSDLKTSQEEMKKYIDLNLKLTNDKIKIQKQYLDDISRINNEKFDKITLFSKSGNNIIIKSGVRDLSTESDIPANK